MHIQSPTVPALVQMLARTGTDRLRDGFAAHGMAELRPLHVPLLLQLLGGGRHAASLVTGLGVSRQAVAQVVSTLERDGYVQRVADPGDARAKLLCRTPKGRAALRIVQAIAREIEGEWRERLGTERFAAFRDSLLTLLPAAR